MKKLIKNVSVFVILTMILAISLNQVSAATKSTFNMVNSKVGGCSADYAIRVDYDSNTKKIIANSEYPLFTNVVNMNGFALNHPSRDVSTSTYASTATWGRRVYNFNTYAYTTYPNISVTVRTN